MKTKTMKHCVHLPKSLGPQDTWCDGPSPDVGHKVGSLKPCPSSLPNHVCGQETEQKRGRSSAEALGREEVFVVQWLPSPFCFVELYERHWRVIRLGKMLHFLLTPEPPRLRLEMRWKSHLAEGGRG